MRSIPNKKCVFIITLSVVLIFSAHISYARYVKTEILNAVQEIAIPIFEIEEGETVKIDKENNIGFYKFSIKNFNEENISEIDFKYTIEIVSDIGQEVQFELYDEEKQILLQNLKSEQISMKGNGKVEKNYKLKIIYNNIKNIKSNTIEKVQIKVYSEQQKV